jgi:peptide deformylase
MTEEKSLGPLLPEDGILKITSGGSVRPMKIEKVLSEGNPLLRKMCEKWDFQNPPFKSIEMARMLIDTAKSESGLGLAAPQIGHSYRVFAIGYKENWQICFNPSFAVDINTREEKIDIEGCLSYPGLLLKVKRFKTIQASFQMPDGSFKTEIFEGLTARCFQHELDHLDGKLFVDHVGEMSLIRAREKRQKLIKHINRQRRRVAHGAQGRG